VTTDFEVAVLGGGISGCMTACLLADEGRSVAIIEQLPLLVDGASRWNDGKIHLGFTFTGTPSISTAALMQEGAAVFIPTFELITGEPIEESWFGEPVIYVVDRQSLFDRETLWKRAQKVAELMESSAGRLPGLRRWLTSPLLERLDPTDAVELIGQDNVTAAWRTSERHISTRAAAERLRLAVKARNISIIEGRVERVSRSSSSWLVDFASGASVSAGVVVNSLWESLAVIDRQVAADAPDEPPVVIRYKYAVFGTNTGLTLQPLTRILGKYGDIATYPNGDAYLSWYPACLAGRSDDGLPPRIEPIDPATLIEKVLAGLRLPPSLLERPGATWMVNGGFVVARGSSDIDRRGSLLHMRDRPRVVELRPGFVSVDTGKYTLGPLMATRAVDIVQRRLGGGRNSVR
jgi:hypothetical protein